MKTFLTLGCLLCINVYAADVASLDAPAQAYPGSAVEVTWTGPGDNYDSIYVLKPDAPDNSPGLHSKSILSKKNPIAVTMPDEPGEFELRYWSVAAKQPLARRLITLTDAPTTLEAPESAPMGAKVEVHWQSAGNAYDLVGLYKAGAADDARSLSNATVLGRNPVIVRLAETPGDYELRYVTRLKKRVLARRPITVTAVASSIDAPDSAISGATIQVTWEGPGNTYDSIQLYPAGAADDAKAVAAGSIVSRRNPVTVRVPEQAGDYEWRYVTTHDKAILARRPFKVVDVLTALEAPDSALAASPLNVGWQGPGNDYDQIQLIDPADEAGKVLSKAAILSGRNPVPLNLPDVEGTFQLRYVTAKNAEVLATRPLLIQPAGRLSVVYERDREMTTSTPASGSAVELILDASGSMLQKLNSGERRIEVAKKVLDEMVREFLSDKQWFALRVFGHKQADSCRTDLEIPLSELNREHAAGLIAGVNAMNLAKTPIADSLKKVPEDLARAKGPKTIVLITDGEETCDGDPAAVISALRAGGLDIQLSIVGFAIDDAELKAEFEQWARLGGGSYFDANSADELLHSLRIVISGPFRVLNDSGEVVGEGIIGGADIVLPAGVYRVEMAGSNSPVIEKVTVKPRELTKAAF